MADVRCLSILCVNATESAAVHDHVAANMSYTDRQARYASMRVELDAQMTNDARVLPPEGRRYSSRDFTHDEKLRHWVNRGPNGYPALIVVPAVAPR